MMSKLPYHGLVDQCLPIPDLLGVYGLAVFQLVQPAAVTRIRLPQHLELVFEPDRPVQ